MLAAVAVLPRALDLVHLRARENPEGIVTLPASLTPDQTGCGPVIVHNVFNLDTLMAHAVIPAKSTTKLVTCMHGHCHWAGISCALHKPRTSRTKKP